MIHGLQQLIINEYDAGMEQGIRITILDLLGDIDKVPEELVNQIYSQKDTAVLRKWSKLARSVNSIEEFIKQM